MKNTAEVSQYDEAAEQISLQQAKAVSPQAYQQRLKGIVNDRASAENESLHPNDAYWSGEYRIGSDGRGNAALVTSELGMIPGRAHRNNSNAMSDSMLRNVAYTLDQINEGNLPHSSWRAAIEQVRQFRAFQKEAVTLADGTSLLGYVMNGLTTEDGIALIRMTRHRTIISYETRLIGGISEGAASDLLEKFVSDDATRVSLKDNHALYTTVKGIIDVDLKDKTLINGVVQDVLDKRHETKKQTIMLGSCRTTAVVLEENTKNVLPIEPKYVQKQEFIDRIPYEKPFIDVSLAPAYIQSDMQPSQQQIWDISVNPWIGLHPPIKKEGVLFFETPEKKNQEVGRQVVEQDIYKEEKRVNMEESDLKYNLVVQTATLSQKESSAVIEEIQREELRPAHSVLPVTTFVVVSDIQTIPTYEEKVFALSLAVMKPTYKKQTIQEDLPIAEHIPVAMYQEEKIQDKQSVTETDSLFEVDQLMIQDMVTVTAMLGRQVTAGKTANVVTKLLWVESNDQDELVPVEEVEIVGDSTRTLQNLLHFLRKVVRTYCGVDSIRPRVIQKIASDKWSDEIGELEEYIAILKTQRMFHHLFATVH